MILNRRRELPYPEWRLALADRAKKAGLGDVGTVMEWLMLTKDAEEPSSMLKSGCGQPTSGADLSREHEEQSAEGAYRRRDTIRPLKFSTSGGISRSYDMFVIPTINEESDGEGEELSECEWEGWT
jgi:hypothetical protein